MPSRAARKKWHGPLACSPFLPLGVGSVEVRALAPPWTIRVPAHNARTKKTEKGHNPPSLGPSVSRRHHACQNPQGVLFLSECAARTRRSRLQRPFPRPIPGRSSLRNLKNGRLGRIQPRHVRKRYSAPASPLVRVRRESALPKEPHPRVPVNTVCKRCRGEARFFLRFRAPEGRWRGKRRSPGRVFEKLVPGRLRAGWKGFRQ